MADYPATPLFTSTSLQSMFPTLFSTTQSGKRNVRKFGAHKWVFTAAYNLLSREEFMPVFAFLMKQEGSYGSFTIIIPDLAVPQGSAGGVPLVNGGSQTGSNLVVDDATASQTGWLKAGDILTLLGDTKVYMVTDDCDSDGSGNVTIPIAPPLFKSPANDSAVTVNNCEMTVMQKGDIQKYGARSPLLYAFEVDFIEVIE